MIRSSKSASRQRRQLRGVEALRSRRVALLCCVIYCAILSCCDVAILAQTSVGTANEGERRLIYDLFKNYNLNIRPAEKLNDTLYVGFQQAMIQVSSLMEKAREASGCIFGAKGINVGAYKCEYL